MNKTLIEKKKSIQNCEGQKSEKEMVPEAEDEGTGQCAYRAIDANKGPHVIPLQDKKDKEN